MKASEILKLLEGFRFSLQDEKRLQEEIDIIFHQKLPLDQIDREHRLDNKNIPDFLLFGNIAVEVKIKGSKKEIYKQCVRYCEFDRVQELILITNIAMGFPEQINNKNCYFFNLSKAWL